MRQFWEPTPLEDTTANHNTKQTGYGAGETEVSSAFFGLFVRNGEKTSGKLKIRYRNKQAAEQERKYFLK